MKRGLVLPGGGSKGAFQVGVLAAMSKEPHYVGGVHCVYGTSVGAINAIAVAMYEPGPDQLAHASRKLLKVWGSLKRSQDIWKLRFPPYVSGLWNRSIGNNKGLRRILKTHLDVKEIRKSGVDLKVSAVDLTTGELKVFGKEYPNLIQAVLASSSFPIAFPPEEMGEGLYTDGGVRDVSPLKPAIDAGCEEIVVIPCRNPWKVPTVRREHLSNIIKIGYRCIDIMEHELLRNDLKTCQRINRRVRSGKTDKRYINLNIIHPDEKIGSALAFDPERIKKDVYAGYSRAKAYFRRSN